MQIVIDSKERKALALSLVNGIMASDCPMSVTIEPYIDKHSRAQRAKFHVLCREWGNQRGYTLGQVKEAIKTVVYGTDEITLGGRVVTVTASSEYDTEGKPRDKVDYSELIEHTYRLAAEEGVILT